MSIAATSLLRDNAIAILAALCYSLFYFIDLIEFGFTVSLCSLQYLCVLIFLYTLSFRSHINPDQKAKKCVAIIGPLNAVPLKNENVKYMLR